MKLYLARHGNAVSASVDDARPLSDLGRAEVARMASFMAGANMQVEAVLHSGKTRARQTAEMYAAALDTALTVREVAGIRPNDGPETILDIVAGLSGDTLIAGHNPFLSSAVSLLVTGRVETAICDLETASVACVEQIPGGGWQLVWLVGPSQLGFVTVTL